MASENTAQGTPAASSGESGEHTPGTMEFHMEEARRRSTYSESLSSRRKKSSAARPSRPRKKHSLRNIDFRMLEMLQQEFVNRWGGQDLGLTREEFKRAMKKTVGYHLDDEELDRMYSKVDSEECDLLRWGNFITSLSSTAILRSDMEKKSKKPLLKTHMEFIETKLRDEVVAIRFIPRLTLYATKINLNKGRYLMLGREGTLTMWSINLCLLASHFVGNEGVTSTTPMYFVDMVVLYPSTMIAVTATDRKITIYDLGSRGIQEKYSIVSVGMCITCMDFWSDLSSRTFSLLLWGDTVGDIHALEMNVNRLGGIFGVDENREIISRVTYPDVLKHKYPTTVLHKVPMVHNQWVTAIRYIPQNKAFLSSSTSNTKQSLCYSDWLGKAETRYFLNMKSVLCFDFNFVIHLVVTGCLDCQVRVWNFFMGSRPFNTLKGHIAPVVHVALNPVSHHVISVDKTHAIKVFDYREGTIIQAFSGPSLECMGLSPITGFFFNTSQCQLTIATTKIAFTDRRVNPPDMAEVSAHEFPIAAVCYSSVFEEIITACMDAVISVWDVHSGKHIIEFKHQSPHNKFKDVPWECSTARLEVTAMTLDSTERCCLTGANDGTVNLWNFSSGVLLSRYDTPQNSLVTGLAVDRNMIYATGWSRQIYIFSVDDKGFTDNYKSFQKFHQDDVNCLALVKGGLIASGSYDGDLIILARDTGQSLCRLNAGESQLPIPMRMKNQDDKSTMFLEPRGSQVEIGEPVGSEESFVDADAEFEDFSIMRCIRIDDEKVVIANPLDPIHPLKIIHKPIDKDASSKHLDQSMVYEVYNGRTVTKEESDNTFRAFESSVDIIICLHSRKHLDLNTANVVTAGAEGWIRAWSLNPKGGLRGQFLATEHLGESVRAMVTDKDNEYLITADTVGYVKIWDLFPYCNNAFKYMTEEDRQTRRDRLIKMFIFIRSAFLRDEASEGFKRCAKHHKRMPPDESNPDQTLKTPKLLNVFRAHMQSITAVTFVDDHQLIITTSKDCSVRVWTIQGSFVGHCGAQWVRLLSLGKSRTLRPLPRDIRRNASARTFRVIKGGRMPAWERAVKLIHNYLEDERKEEQKRAKMEAEKVKSGKAEVSEDDEAWMAPAVLIEGPETVEPELQLRNVVNFNWKDPKKSKLLGMSFKPYLHHRPVHYTPRINVKEDFGQLAAYRQVPISDINEFTDLPTPQIIKDIEKRRREEEEEAKLYRSSPKKMRGTRRGRKSIFSPSCGESPSQSTVLPGSAQRSHNKLSTASKRNSTQNYSDAEAKAPPPTPATTVTPTVAGSAAIAAAAAATGSGLDLFSTSASENTTQNNEGGEFCYDQCIGRVAFSSSGKNLTNNEGNDREPAAAAVPVGGDGAGRRSRTDSKFTGAVVDSLHGAEETDRIDGGSGGDSAPTRSQQRRAAPPVPGRQGKRLRSQCSLPPISEDREGARPSLSTRSSVRAAQPAPESTTTTTTTHAFKSSSSNNNTTSSAAESSESDVAAAVDDNFVESEGSSWSITSRSEYRCYYYHHKNGRADFFASCSAVQSQQEKEEGEEGDAEGSTEYCCSWQGTKQQPSTEYCCSWQGTKQQPSTEYCCSWQGTKQQPSKDSATTCIFPPLVDLPGSAATTTTGAKLSPKSPPPQDDGSATTTSQRHSSTSSSSNGSGEMTPKLPDIQPAKTSDSSSSKTKKELFRGTGLVLMGTGDSSLKRPGTKYSD